MNTIQVMGALFISAGTIELGEMRHAEIEENDAMTIVRIIQDEPDGTRRLAGFNITCDEDKEGNEAYDLGAMLTMQIERDFAR